MYRVEESRLFRKWQDPSSGVVSYILAERAAPCQQSFYFTNPGMSADGRYLWFYGFAPPAGSAESGRVLGVADLAQNTVRVFPETQFRDASPWVDPATGDVFWAWDYTVWCRPADPSQPARAVNAVPPEIHQFRYGKRLATHLTRSADGKEFFIDAAFGREWVAGSLPLDGRPFQIWKRFDRCYNHAQFSPVDPDLALIAQDWWFDVATGEKGEYTNRMWLLGRDGAIRSLYGPERGRHHTHEWWDAAGGVVWYVDFTSGTWQIDIRTGRDANMWPNAPDPEAPRHCHAHADRTGRFLAGDPGTYPWRPGTCSVRFCDTDTGRTVDIAAGLPPPDADMFRKYHLHPHPQFCAGDRYICYTTTVLGGIDVAVTPVAQLPDRLR